MKLFCLIHGSTQDARCWDLLAPELERRGQRVVRASLPTDNPAADTDFYAKAILSSIPGNSEEVVLVGHSASGYFLPLVAERRRVQRMVFLAAIIPQIGVSFLDQLRADSTLLQPNWIGKDPSKDESVALDFLFHDCPPEVAQWALTTRILLPLQKVASEVYPLQHWPEVESSYILCKDDRTINPEWSRRAARERLGVEAIEIPGGHSPYLSRPAQLADVLVHLDEHRQ